MSLWEQEHLTNGGVMDLRQSEINIYKWKVGKTTILKNGALLLIGK
jgi:hypothetical protein